MFHHLRIAVVPVYLTLCLILGGASAAGVWANMALQLIAIAIITWSLAERRTTPLSVAARQLTAIMVLILALVGLQLIPLPPGLWTQLPGRQEVVEGFRLLDLPLPWLPWSLDPQRTVSSALWLLPAFATFLGIVRLGAYRASWLAWTLVGVITLSIAVGALQVAGGYTSPWYFYKITNHGQIVGFFANANHLAILLVATIPFLAALYLKATARGASMQRSSALFLLLGGALAVIFVGIAVNGSLAGLGLSLPVLAASGLMVLARKRRVPAWSWAVVALLLLGSVLTVFSAPFENNLTGAGAAESEDSRQTSFRLTAKAASEFVPLGSGLGTFQQIYRLHEDPARVDPFFMNHAHSDYLELWLETGIPGLLIVMIFLVWWSRRTVHHWKSEEPDHFARAATITSAAILAHSIVEYPLRTMAISALFAMCCALMAEPRAKVKQAKAVPADKQARHLSAD